MQVSRPFFADADPAARTPHPKRAAANTGAPSVRQVCQATAVAVAALAKPALADPSPIGGHVATFASPNGTVFGVHGNHTAFWDSFIFRSVQSACHATEVNMPFNASWPQVATASYYNGNRYGIIAYVGEIYAPDPSALSDNFTNCVVSAMNAGNCNADGALWGIGCGVGFGVPTLAAASIIAACYCSGSKRQCIGRRKVDEERAAGWPTSTVAPPPYDGPVAS